jgi:hypothetical protein
VQLRLCSLLVVNICPASSVGQTVLVLNCRSLSLLGFASPFDLCSYSVPDLCFCYAVRLVLCVVRCPHETVLLNSTCCSVFVFSYLCASFTISCRSDSTVPLHSALCSVLRLLLACFQLSVVKSVTVPLVSTSCNSPKSPCLIAAVFIFPNSA